MARPLRLLAALVLAVLCLPPCVSAADLEERSRFGRDGLAFHRLPLDPGADGQARATIVDLVAAPDGKLVAALGNDYPGSRNAYLGVARFNADGSLDRSFGSDGFAAVVRPRLGRALGLSYGQGEAVAVDRRGRVVLAGYRFDGPGSSVRYPVLVRLLPNGAPDPSFGQAGVVTPRRVAEYGEWFAGVAIQPGGRIVAAGGRTQLRESFREGLRSPATLVRGFRPDGRVDRGFAERGSLVSIAPKEPTFTAFRTVRALPGGKLLLSGYRGNRLLVERLLPGGRPDPSFGRRGAVAIGFDVTDCYYLCELQSALTLTRGGRIVVQGVLNPLGQSHEALVSYLPDGRIDRGFGRRGISFDRFSENLTGIGGIVPAPGGRFLVVGSGSPWSRRGPDALVVLRFNPNGRLDRDFADHGMLPLYGPGRGPASGDAAVVGAGGAIVAAGAARVSQQRTGAREQRPLLMLARVP